jgi:hypothetical protein
LTPGNCVDQLPAHCTCVCSSTSCSVSRVSVFKLFPLRQLRSSAGEKNQQPATLPAHTLHSIICSARMLRLPWRSEIANLMSKGLRKPLACFLRVLMWQETLNTLVSDISFRSFFSSSRLTLSLPFKFVAVSSDVLSLGG